MRETLFSRREDSFISKPSWWHSSSLVGDLGGLLLSLAQWSRASLLSFSKSRGPNGAQAKKAEEPARVVLRTWCVSWMNWAGRVGWGW